MAADATIEMVIEAGLAGTDQMAQEARQAMKGYESFFNGIGRAANVAFVTVASAAAGVGAAALAGVASLIQFEDAFAGIRKTVDADEATLQRLAGSIRELATELPVAATELARIGELGGQLGIEAENIEAFTEVVTKLSVATVLSTENAALALARLGAIASIPERELDDFFQRTGASIVELGNNFAATEDEIITTVLRIATAAEQSGASTQDALAFATALQAIGVPAQAGGTAIARVFQEIQRAIQNGGEQLALFASIAGTTSEQFQKDFAEDAATAVVTFIEGLSTAEDRINGVQNVLQKLNLSQRRTQLAVNGLATAQGLLRDALITSRSAYEANVALNVEAAKKFATTKQQLVLLKNQIQEATMQLGEFLLPILRKIIFSIQAFTKGVIETNFGLEHFIDLFSRFFKIIIAGKLIQGIGLLIVELKRFTITTQAASMSTALLTLLTGNFVKVLGSIAAIGSFAVLLNKLKKEFNEIKETGGAVSLSNVLQDVDEFGAGANDTLKDLIQTQGILKSEFRQQAGVSFESVLDPNDQVTADSIRKSLDASGLEIDESEVSKILNAALYIQGLETNITNLSNSLEFVMEQAVENITNAGGAVGDFFTTLNQMRDNSEIDKFFRDVFMEGKDIVVAAEELLPVLAEQEGALQSQIDVLTENGMELQEQFDQHKQLTTELTKVQLLRQDILDMRIGETAIGQGVLLREKEQTKALAEQILLRQKGSNFIDKEAESLANTIIEERKRRDLELQRLGLSQSVIDNMETSATAAAHLNAVRQENIDLAKTELEEQFNIIAEQVIISGNIEAIAKQSSRNIVSLFKDVPAQIKMSASEMTRNLQDQAIISAEFMATIQALQARGFQALAATLAQEGPAALTAAQDFLNAPQLAQEAEANLRVMREDLLKSLAEIPDEIDISSDELREKFEPFGGDIVDGLSKGIRENSDEIKAAIIAAVENGEKGLILEFGIKSPAKRFIPYGQAFADALAEGMKKNGGKFSVEVLQAAKDAAQDLSNFSMAEQTDLMEWANTQIEEINESISNNMNLESLFSSDAYKQGLANFKTDLISTFDLFTQFDTTFTDFLNSEDAIKEAREEYNEVVKEGTENLQKQVDLTDELSELNIKFGAEGVTTAFEQLQIDKASLRLLQMKSQLNKKDTASERLAIKDAKRELEFLEQANKRGVATDDEVQAARERLAELTGTTEGIDDFDNRKDFQAMLDLQKDILKAETKFQEDLVTAMTADALLVDPKITALQEKINDLQTVVDSQNKREEAAQENISNEKMNQFNTQLKLFELADRIVSLGPEGVEHFKSIATAAGMPVEQIDKIIANATTMGETFATKFDDVATNFFDTKFKMEEAVKLNIDTTQAEADIANIKRQVNEIYASFNMELPFPDEGLVPTNEQLMQGFLNYERERFFGGEGGAFNPFGNDSPKAMGGLIDVGKRALVGEFGPEIVSVRPSGAHVERITNNTSSGVVVNNLNVNVTGIPASQQHARKAAQEIRKALVNLEKEGTSNSITLR